MNSYRNFSPSPRNGWIIAWMSNYSVRFLRQREWDKVTLLLPLPPFRFIPHLTKPSSIETCIVINNFHRHHSKERISIHRRNKEKKKYSAGTRKGEEKWQQNNHPSQQFTPLTFTSTIPFHLEFRIAAFRYLVAAPSPPDYINFISEAWMNGYWFRVLRLECSSSFVSSV